MMNHVEQSLTCANQCGFIQSLIERFLFEKLPDYKRFLIVLSLKEQRILSTNKLGTQFLHI